MNNKIDKIISILNKDIKYYEKNKLFNKDYKDTMKMKYDVILGKYTPEEIENIYNWIG